VNTVVENLNYIPWDLPFLVVVSGINQDFVTKIEINRGRIKPVRTATR
jgi:hypothetical protein